jgi:cyanophycinase
MHRLAGVILVFLSFVSPAQKNSYCGIFLLSGGSFEDTLATKTFVDLLSKKSGSTIAFIPTGSSGIKLPNGYIYIPPQGDTTKSVTEAFEKELAGLIGVQKVIVLHTRDKKTANSETFVSPIRQVDGAWLGPGNAGRLADAYLGTNTQKELKALSARGGVIAGTSAGAIILGSYVVRGWTEKPMLMAKGHDKGFGFIEGIAVNPHVISQKREYELISVVHEYPNLLGIAIDDFTSIVVKDGEFTVIGKSKVAIYDNKKYGDKWYYWLSPGDRFDLVNRRKMGQ